MSTINRVQFKKEIQTEHLVHVVDATFRSYRGKWGKETAVVHTLSVDLIRILEN